MDVSVLLQAVTEILTPALPFLVQGSEKTLEAIGGKIGKQGWELVSVVLIPTKGGFSTHFTRIGYFKRKIDA